MSSQGAALRLLTFLEINVIEKKFLVQPQTARYHLCKCQLAKYNDVLINISRHSATYLVIFKLNMH